ncbi:MAG TPA: hypothetical protein PL091_05975 [Actinomycetota bacterium]|nr:hypothetical protein [Actinomycetota bacterium]HRY09875.1 hypothetical protein [Candidatus Nanopelagicales bacterium]
MTPDQDSAMNPQDRHSLTGRSIASGPGAGPRTTLVLAVVLILGLLLVALPAALLGSLQIPHNDGWAYSRIAQTLADTGRIELVGWNRPALVGHVLLLVPGTFVGAVTGQHLIVLVLAATLLAATYDLVAGQHGWRWGVLATATMACYPGLPLLATSTMTDVPAVAGSTAALALGARGLHMREGSSAALLLLSAATLLGFWGLTVREQAIAAPVAVLLVALWTWRRSRSRGFWAAAGLLGGLAVATAAFEYWRRGLPGDDPPTLLTPHLGTLSFSLLSMLLALGLVCLPLSIGPGWRAMQARLGRPVASVVLLLGLFLPLLLNAAGRPTLVENGYLDIRGAYRLTNPTPDVADPSPFLWYAMAAGGALGLILLTAVLLDTLVAVPRDPGTTETLALVFLVLMAAVTVIQVIGGQAAFERYNLPLVPALAVLTAASWQRRSGPGRLRGLRALTGLSLAVLAGFSALISLNAWAVDSARWRAAEDVALTGWPATDIDPGMEWVGWHAEGVADQDATEGPQDLTFWSAWFPKSRSCVIISDGPVAGTIPSGRTWSYRSFGFFGPREVLAQRINGAPACRRTADGRPAPAPPTGSG